MDVIRSLGNTVYISFLKDCMTCFLCEEACPSTAICWPGTGKGSCAAVLTERNFIIIGGQAMVQDLRSFIQEMNNVNEDWCEKVSSLIHPEKFEASALAKNIANKGKEKALYFTNVTNLASNKFTTLTS